MRIRNEALSLAADDFPANGRGPTAAIGRATATARHADDAADRGVLARIGPLEARLAVHGSEIAAAQNLRYRVFFEEMGAAASPLQRATHSDRDDRDDDCDHLLVLDRGAGSGDCERIVATCRLMARPATGAGDRPFYSQGEFDIAAMLAAHRGRRFVELGRSCVLSPWRGKRVIELLWAAIWRYVRLHGIDVLIGCASFPGTEPAAIANPLAFLRHFATAPPHWQVRAWRHVAVSMACMGRDKVDARRAMRDLPPLIRGYLRLGAMFAAEAAIDRRFGTIDVFVILPIERINSRYVAFYGANAERHRRG